MRAFTLKESILIVLFEVLMATSESVGDCVRGGITWINIFNEYVIYLLIQTSLWSKHAL